MVNTQPIKRSKELAPLSREHHDGLLLCWKINTGLRKAVEPERICKYVIYFFDNALRQHFSEEELFVFPLLGPTNTLRKNAEIQHQVLRDIINNLRTSPHKSADLLRHFAQLLNEHIRYEERVLFPEIEQQATAKLKTIEEKLSTHNNNAESWNDQFWLN